MTAAAAPSWVCESNFIRCANDHLLSFRERDADPRGPGLRADLRRMAGHAFLQCRTCKPPTFLFAVFTTQPDPHVKLYAIAEASYREWATAPDTMSLSTPEMLHLLRDPDGRSYNPAWIPPK